MLQFDANQLLGPLSGLVISLLFCGYFLQSFKSATEDVKAICREMAEAFRAESKACNERYERLAFKVVELESEIKR